MPRAAPNVGNVGEIHALQRDHPTENLSSAFKDLGIALKAVSRQLLDALKMNHRSRNTQAATPPPQAAQPPQGPAHAGQAAAATPAPPAPVFDAKKWLTEQCKQLSDALSKKTDDKPNLQAIYKAAQALKDSIPANLPQDLERDFLDNVAIIQNYFNSDDNTRAISRDELGFLHAYINFLKTCVSAHPELEKSLADVSSALHKALTELNQDQQLAQDKATQLTNEAVRLRTEADRALQAAQAPAQGDAADGNAQAARLTRLAAEAEQRVEDATRELDHLRQSPEEKAIAKLKGEIDALDQRIEELYNTLAEQTGQDPGSAAVVTTRGQIRQCEADLEAKRNELNDAENALTRARTDNQTMLESTLELTTRGNTQQIARVLTSDENFNSRNLEQTQQQLKDTVSLLYVDKKANKDWLNHSIHFQKLGETLAANPGTATSLPADFEHLPSPQDKVVNDQKVGDQTVYQHALKILTNNGNGAQIDNELKILACQVLGRFCAMQAICNSDPASHVKLTIPMTNAAQMLAAKLALKATQNTNDPLELKDALKKHAKNFDLKNLEQVLDVVPDNTAPENLRSLFLQGVTLATVKTNDENRTDLAALIKSGTTNRTYEKDVTALKGASRQKVFKESMFRAVAVLANLIPAEGNGNQNESRTNRAEQAARDLTAKLQNENQDLLDRLAFDNPATNDAHDGLLDQLALASMVQNDLSLDKGHVPRGSMMSHINKYEKHSQRESLKNHNLHGFKALGEFLTATAIHIRPHVDRQINQIKTLQSTNNLPSNREIDRLVKQIIVTTDAKAAGNENFKFRELIGTAESLKKSRSEGDLKAFQDELTSVQNAWNAAKEQANAPPSNTQWVTSDQRSSVSRALNSNLVKSIPFINQTPGVGRFTAIASNLAKGLLAATAGAAGGTVALGAGVVVGAGVIGGAVVAAPIYGAYYAIQKTF